MGIPRNIGRYCSCHSMLLNISSTYSVHNFPEMPSYGEMIKEKRINFHALIKAYACGLSEIVLG